MLKVTGFWLVAILTLYAPREAATQEWCGGTTGLSDTGSPYATCRYTSQQQCHDISYNCNPNPFGPPRPSSAPSKRRHWCLPR